MLRKRGASRRLWGIEDFSNTTIRRAECNTKNRGTEDGELTYSFYRLDSDKGRWYYAGRGRVMGVTLRRLISIYSAHLINMVRKSQNTKTTARLHNG